MALHVQMSPEAEAELKRINLRNKIASLFSCLAFMGVACAILYLSVIYIENTTPAAFDVYTSPDNDAAESKRPKVKDLSASASAQSKVAPSVIVSLDQSSLAMVEVDIPVAQVDLGVGDVLDLGLGTGGLGKGLGSGGGGLGSGDTSGSALEGSFFDFKQTRNGAAIGKNQSTHALAELLEKNWSPSVLNKYYQAKVKLYASHFLIAPSTPADLVPQSYNAKGVEAVGVGAIYRGKVRAPKSGRFRFVGTGDDTLIVRFNRKLVLEGGFYIPSLGKSDITKGNGPNGSSEQYRNNPAGYPGHEGYQLIPHANLNWNHAIGGLTGGTVFEVEEGKVYPIEIMITEVFGGIFGLALFIEDLDNPAQKDGKPILELFRTNFSKPDAKAKAPFNFNEESLIWNVVP